MKLFSKLWDFLINNLDRILVGLLVFLVIISIGVMGFDCVKNCVSGLVGLTAKNKILTFLGIGMGGILFILQVLASHRRAKAMEDAANEQANSAKAQARATEEQARANENTEQGQRQERLKNAIEHLGNKKESVRWGGAYELFHLAKDSKELSQTALDMLCLHIRQTTSENEYRGAHASKPSEEIQSLLRLLFVQEHEVFKGCDINLQGSWLNGADLRKARLQGAILTGAHLQKADLREACLQGADLKESHLQKAKLCGACLQGADLERAHLQGAFLREVHLQGARLRSVRLQGADLGRARLQMAALDSAQLQGAFLREAHLQGALLVEAHLQDADLRGAHLQGADLGRARLQMAALDSAQLQEAGRVQWSYGESFEDRIQMQIGKETDLSGVIFSGGLSQKNVDSLVEDLSEEKANELREKLEPHIGKPISNELPESSGAITVPPYTEEEAEKWIAEYKEAMSEVPEGDS